MNTIDRAGAVLPLMLLCSSLTAADDFKVTDTQAAAIKKQAEKIRSKGSVPSFVVGVVSKDRLVYAKGFGFRNLKEKRPAKADTLYHIGSVSKPITATVLALLIRKGAVDLDDRIKKYLPDHVRLPTYTVKKLT